MPVARVDGPSPLAITGLGVLGRGPLRVAVPVEEDGGIPMAADLLLDQAVEQAGIDARAIGDHGDPPYIEGGAAQADPRLQLGRLQRWAKRSSIHDIGL